MYFNFLFGLPDKENQTLLPLSNNSTGRKSCLSNKFLGQNIFSCCKMSSLKSRMILTFCKNNPKSLSFTKTLDPLPETLEDKDEDEDE